MTRSPRLTPELRDASCLELARRYNPPMPFAAVNGLRIFYEDSGPPGAVPVVLLHELGGAGRSWEPVRRRLTGRRLIAVDLRDSGRSDRATVAYGMAEMARDVAELLQRLGAGSAAVAGFSMGGAVAQELALARPELVRLLVLIATHDTGDSRGTAIFEQFVRLRRLLSCEDYQRTVLPWVYAHGEYAGAIDSERAVESICADPLYQEPEAYERQATATVRFSSRERLGGIRCPTQLIFGDEDLLTPLRFARSLVEGIHGARLAVLAGAGHGLLWTRPAEVAGLIEAFLLDNAPLPETPFGPESR